jgi:hypothetical protein
MKAFYTLKSFLLILVISFTFIGCSDSNSEKEDNKETEVIKLNSGTDYAVQLVKTIKNDKLIMDKTTANEVNAIFGIEIHEYQMDSTVNFDGYRLERKFNIYENKVSSITFSTFSNNYEEENQEVTKDMKMVTQELINILGEPFEKSEMNTMWIIHNTSIYLATFESGFDLNIDKYITSDENSFDEYGANCVGDFYNLKKDLTDLFLDNIKSEKILVGKTTKAEMIKMFGGTNYNKEYDGLSLTGKFSFENEKLSSINLDYKYNCDGALSFLSQDNIEIEQDITNFFILEPKSNIQSNYKEWKTKNHSITLSNFSDGYNISILE